MQPVKSIQPPSKYFLSYPKNVIFIKVTHSLQCFYLLY